MRISNQEFPHHKRTKCGMKKNRFYNSIVWKIVGRITLLFLLLFIGPTAKRYQIGDLGRPLDGWSRRQVQGNGVVISDPTKRLTLENYYPERVSVKLIPFTSWPRGSAVMQLLLICRSKVLPFQQHLHHRRIFHQSSGLYSVTFLRQIVKVDKNRKLPFESHHCETNGSFVCTRNPLADS